MRSLASQRPWHALRCSELSTVSFAVSFAQVFQLLVRFRRFVRELYGCTERHYGITSTFRIHDSAVPPRTRILGVVLGGSTSVTT